MEKWTEVPVEVVNEVSAQTSSEGVAKKIIKNAAIAGVVGMAHLSGVQESVASDGFQTKEKTPARTVEVVGRMVEGIVKKPATLFVESLKGDFRKLKELVTKKDLSKESKKDNVDTKIFVDDRYTWGIEYVPKTNDKGDGVLADRYVKIDNKTGEKTVLVESAKVYELKAALEKIDGLPEEVLAYASVVTDALDEEKKIVASGFVEPTSKKPAVKTEIREYKGWKNTVEVDEDGAVVKILSSESLVENPPEKK